MTIVAGVSLFNGVMITADCRVTIKRRGRPPIHCDTLQKMFPLTSTTVIAFCGDVETASIILKEIFRQLRHRKRHDAISLYAWIPRFLRATFLAINKKGKARPVHFMVASVQPGWANTVERKRVVELAKVIAFNTGRMQRNWMPEILINILSTDPRYEFVSISGTIAGLLYSLKAPHFVAENVAPLEFDAIGSGAGSITEVRKSADWILAGVPGDMGDSFGLRGAVSDFIHENKIDDVGGMYPCIKIDQRGINFLGMRYGFPGEQIKLTYDLSIKRWIQENQTTGKKIALMYPWEIKAWAINNDSRFDDYSEAVNRFRFGGTKRRSETPPRNSE